jgi:hypothetical protein
MRKRDKMSVEASTPRTMHIEIEPHCFSRFFARRQIAAGQIRCRGNAKLALKESDLQCTGPIICTTRSDEKAEGVVGKSCGPRMSRLRG